MCLDQEKDPDLSILGFLIRKFCPCFSNRLDVPSQTLQPSLRSSRAFSCALFPSMETVFFLEGGQLV